MGAGQTVAAFIRRSFGAFVAAPLAVALVVVPEFAQHCAEIALGMFDSEAAFAARATDPTRVAFGAVKVTGLVLAVLAVTRFWLLRGTGQDWWSLRTVHWRWFFAGAALGLLLPLPVVLLQPLIDPVAYMGVQVVITIATAPFAFMMLVALGRRPPPGVRAFFTVGWLSVVTAAVLLLLTWPALQILHEKMHVWAFGRAQWEVWALMTADALLVGLMAAVAGAALSIAVDQFDRLTTK